jgi:hypothetical protein
LRRRVRLRHALAVRPEARELGRDDRVAGLELRRALEQRARAGDVACFSQQRARSHEQVELVRRTLEQRAAASRQRLLR